MSLQPMIPPTRFDIFLLTGGCSEGLDAFSFFLKKKYDGGWWSFVGNHYLPWHILFVASGFEWFTASCSVAVESCSHVYQRTRQKERKERKREREWEQSICLQEFGVITPTHDMSLHDWSKNVEP